MIVITGASGQVGIDLKKLLQKKKINFVSFSKKELDITDTKKVHKILNKYKIKILINLAAYTNVELAENKKKLNTSVNFIGIKNLCNYIGNKKILLITISTDYVFDGSKKTYYNEQDLTSPLNQYGLSKQKSEIFIEKKLNRYLIFRSSWIFSKNNSSFFNFINNSINKRINLIDDNQGNPTSAYSLSKAILRVIEYYSKFNKIKYGIYHFCNYPKTNWYDFGIYYSKLCGHNIKKIYKINMKELNLKAIRPKNSSLDSTKFEKTFNFKRVYWKKELKRIIN